MTKYSGPMTNEEKKWRQNQSFGSPLQQMTTFGASQMPAIQEKLQVACLGQEGDLAVYVINLTTKQTQMINKIFFQHRSNPDIVETVVDHQFHNGSGQYSLVLTDQGNIHIYYLFGDSEQLHGMEGNYRGTIRVAKGSNQIQ